MADYFKPVRRKCGVATLTLASLFIFGMILSITFTDQIKFYTDSTVYRVSSTQNWIELTYYSHPSDTEAFKPMRIRGAFRLLSEKLKPKDTSPPAVKLPLESRNNADHVCFLPPERTPSWWRSMGFELYEHPHGVVGHCLDMHYLYCVVPLSLISVFLLLSQPRIADHFANKDNKSSGQIDPPNASP